MAKVINMADHRELINPAGTIGFAFETVLTEQELNARVRVLADTVEALGGKLEGGRGEAVELIATDSATGTDWEGGGGEDDYKREKKPVLEDLLQYFQPFEMASYTAYSQLPQFLVMNISDCYIGRPFEITQIHIGKRGQVLAVFSYDEQIPMKKRDFAQDQIDVYHRLRKFNYPKR